jgi:putative acetyltransferase
MTARAQPQFALRPYLPQDADALAEIFRASIAELTEEDYSPEQQQAWASAADDEEKFAARLADNLTLIATLEGTPVGFVTLKDNRSIELLYVHPAVARHGVGGLLLEAVEKLAAARGASQLVVDASDTAREFFARRGFVPEQRNSVSVGDEWLTNTTMKKRLAKGNAP